MAETPRLGRTHDRRPVSGQDRSAESARAIHVDLLPPAGSRGSRRNVSRLADYFFLRWSLGARPAASASQQPSSQAPSPPASWCGRAGLAAAFVAAFALPRPSPRQSCRRPLFSAAVSLCCLGLRLPLPRRCRKIALLFWSDLKSVSYQPSPFRRNTGAEIRRFIVGFLQLGHFFSGSIGDLL